MSIDDVPKTMADIAEELGVSVPTVSKVLNGRRDVAPQTRARVEAAIERHQYRRRGGGRGPAGTSLIELALHQFDFAWAVELVKGVERVAAEARVGVVLSELGGAHRPRDEWIDDVLARRPLGVILVLAQLDVTERRRLEDRGIPMVVVDTAGDALSGVPAVGSANWHGGLIATRHLLGLGHRRIAAITGPPDMLCSRARVDGYRTALEEVGVELDPAIVRRGDFLVSGGHAHTLDLMVRPDRPSAIFAGSDLQAVGVLRAARDLGLRVPEDLSVVGYDDVPLAAWTGPPLTTVRQPLQEMAGTAARMVLQLARGQTPANPSIDLATELVVRASTAPYRER